jgi:hypothetical protein
VKTEATAAVSAHVQVQSGLAGRQMSVAGPYTPTRNCRHSYRHFPKNVGTDADVAT